jgi:hypothetical protein
MYGDCIAATAYGDSGGMYTLETMPEQIPLLAPEEAGS